MEDKEALERIGQLIVEAHRDRFPSRRQFALATGMDVKTITTAERGDRELHPTTQRRIEQALGWRKGSIQEIWDNRHTLDSAKITLAEMERGASSTNGVNGAATGNSFGPGNLSQFHTEEILSELMYRVRNYKTEISRLNGLLARESDDQPD